MAAGFWLTSWKWLKVGGVLLLAALALSFLFVFLLLRAFILSYYSLAWHCMPRNLLSFRNMPAFIFQKMFSKLYTQTYLLTFEFIILFALLLLTFFTHTSTCVHSVIIYEHHLKRIVYIRQTFISLPWTRYFRN